MPKKGSSTSRKHSSRGAKGQVQEVAVAGAPNAGALYLETIAEGGSAAGMFQAHWGRLAARIESDIQRIRAAATSNISRSDKGSLRFYAQEVEKDLNRALSGVEVATLFLGAIDDNLRFAREEHEGFLIVPAAPPKQSRSRKATTSTRKSQ